MALELSSSVAKVDILGSKISVFDLDETVEALKQLTSANGKDYICVSNVHTVVMGEQDPEFAKVTNEAILATPDGVPLVWASRFVAGPKIHGRASGPDILAKILADASANHVRHFFYGSTNSVLQKLESKLKQFAPDAQFAGFFSPPMRPARSPSTPLDADELADCKRINDSGAHIVWVGLGAPKQEVWMHRARPHLNAQVLIGVGAAFDFLAGNKQRAPAWMQHAGLEWLHRWSQEPMRLATRYLSTNPRFVFSVLKQAVFGIKK